MHESTYYWTNDARAARRELRCVVAFIFRRFWIEPRNNPLSILPEISGESIPSCHCRYPQKLGLVGIADLGVHRILPRCTITWPGLPAAPPLAPNPPPDGWGYLRSLTTSRTPDTCATTVCACSAVPATPHRRLVLRYLHRSVRGSPDRCLEDRVHPRPLPEVLTTKFP
jgi:hypothetical protein